jgi:hypothetical protein
VESTGPAGRGDGGGGTRVHTLGHDSVTLGEEQLITVVQDVVHTVLGEGQRPLVAHAAGVARSSVCQRARTEFFAT